MITKELNLGAYSSGDTTDQGATASESLLTVQASH